MGSNITYVDFRTSRSVGDAPPPAYKPHLVLPGLREPAYSPIRNGAVPHMENAGYRSGPTQSIDHLSGAYGFSTHGFMSSQIVRNVKCRIREISARQFVKYNRLMGRPLKWHGMTDLGIRLEVVREVRKGGGRGEFAKEVEISDSAYSNYLFDTKRAGFSIDDIVRLCDRYRVSLDWVVRGILDHMPYNDAVRFDEKFKELRARVDGANALMGVAAAEA